MKAKTISGKANPPAAPLRDPNDAICYRTPNDFKVSEIPKMGGSLIDELDQRHLSGISTPTAKL